MSEIETMTFAASYVLASKVRSKLTKQAASPKCSLRQLVLQANMLDNIMDHITTKTEQMRHTQAKKVTFSEPAPVSHDKHIMEIHNGPSVTEYEVDSDSDSDSDSDYEAEMDSISYSSVEDDDDEVFSSLDSESESEDAELAEFGMVSMARKNTMPVLDLSDDSQLQVIYEETEDELPDLSRLVSNSESESEEDMHMPNYVLSTAHANKSSDSLVEMASGKNHEKAISYPRTLYHHRSNAVSLEHVF